MFNIHDLEYTLPRSLIAQEPAPERDQARLLTLSRATGVLVDQQMTDLPALLEAGDLLILNDTKVLPARFLAWRKTGGKVPGLFEAEERDGEWRVILQHSRRLRIGETLTVDTHDHVPLVMRLLESTGGGQWRVRVDSDDTLDRILERIGHAPLPPYIHRDAAAPDANGADRRRYQTVYARRPGAIAAPTAGLHFTEQLLDRIRARGVETAFVTLHVGAGTFKPISAQSLERHTMHREAYDLPAATVEAVGRCRARKGRVVAVGTTTVRVLESAALAGGGNPTTLESTALMGDVHPTDLESTAAVSMAAAPSDYGPTDPLNPEPTERLTPGQATTDLFIHPPFRFRIVDALLTNFHLPRSTLLALVMAFARIEPVQNAYAHAIDHRYRFYSYGDAMLIH